MKKIKAILQGFNSEADMYGNRYFAFIYTDIKTGKQARGTVAGGESNIRSIIFTLCGDSWIGADHYFLTQTEMRKREYNRFTAGWMYAGCSGQQLVDFIKKTLKFDK